MMDQAAVLRRLTPEARLRAACALIDAARSLKAAAFKAQHPDWTDEQVWRAVREAFLHARE